MRGRWGNAPSGLIRNVQNLQRYVHTCLYPLLLLSTQLAI
jgi:hypothetical protein